MINDQIKSCVFDAFGTLFTLQIPLEKIDVITDGKGQELLDIWRRKQLEYTWLTGLMEAYLPFDKVTGAALNYAMDKLDIKAMELYDLLLPIYAKAIAFDTVKPMLSELKKQDIRRAILSNGTPEMLEAGTQNADIRDLIDPIFSVDRVKMYKPSPKVYQMVLDGLKIDATEVLFISANQWDIAGASQFGLQTVWVNRNNETREKLPVAKYQIKSLAELPGLIVQI